MCTRYLGLAKPLDFRDSYEKISPSKQTVEATYLTGGAVLEFNDFNNLKIKNNPKLFWNKYQPYIPNKYSKDNCDIFLIEKDEKLLKNKKIDDVFNSYFQSITGSLDLFQWPLESTDQIYDSIDKIVVSFQFHPSIKNIKHNYKITSKFFFKPVSERICKRFCK